MELDGLVRRQVEYRNHAFPAPGGVCSNRTNSAKLAHMRVNLGLMALSVTISFNACMIEQRLVLGNEFSGVWTLEGRTMHFAGGVLEDLAVLGGYDNSDAFYDEALSEAIAGLEARGDVEDFKIDRVGKHVWTADVEFRDIRSFLGDAALGGIADIRQDGDMYIFSLRFNHARASELENLLPIIKEPAFSLFNPAKNEGFSEEEYITEILGFTFGEENLPELRRAMLTLSITVPGTVVDVEGGTKLSENSARFEVPFTRLLVPEKEIIWLVSWRKWP